MNESSTPKRKLWQYLIEPHAAITDRTQRRRASILAGLSLTLLVMSIGLTIWGIAVGGNLNMTPLASALLYLSTYTISRTRYAEIGSYLLVFGLLILNFSSLTVFAEAEPIAQSLGFLVLPVLLATLLLDAKATFLLAGLTIGGFVLLVFLTPWVQMSDVLAPFIAVAAIAAIAGATALIRERDLVIIQQQASAVEQHSQALEKDIERMKAVAAVGQLVTEKRNLDELLRDVVNLIVQQFDFYHAQIFLLDEAGRYAVLRASTGEVGRKLLARGHRLEAGSRSVIGQVVARGEPVIATDTDTDPIHRRNELLPNTRSEMALPLQVSGRVIGVLDVQSVRPDAFQPTDVSVFQTMADQLAIAIENARLFEQAERDLRDIELLNRQLTGEAWRDFISGRPTSARGFRATAEGIQPIKSEAESPRSEAGAISLPLKVRGETIGVLDLTPRSGEPPDEETRDMLAAVAERVALALDSTRLGEQAQRQAEREQFLSHLSRELHATTDLRSILRIAARSVSRALGTSRSFVHLTMKSDEGQEQ